MDPKNLPEIPTKGVMRRTIQGLAGRIDHVETLNDKHKSWLNELQDRIQLVAADMEKRLAAIESRLGVMDPFNMRQPAPDFIPTSDVVAPEPALATSGDTLSPETGEPIDTAPPRHDDE